VVLLRPNKITPEQITAYAMPLSDPGAPARAAGKRERKSFHQLRKIVAKYKSIQTPTLIIWGRQDALLPLESGERLHRDIQNSTLKVIDQCGHIPQEERPEITVSEIATFADGLRAVAAASPPRLNR